MQMAVFLLNHCKFQGCGLTFPTLADLIQHIEDSHIDSDPRVLEKHEIQQPAALALSYILRFFTDAARKENAEIHRKKVRSQSPAVSVRSTTPTGSEFDEEEAGSDDEDSDDSWTTQEEFTTELILSMMGSKDGDGDKPFACPVPGCKKRYKNVNGIKYHARHGHRKDTSRVKKAFKCRCGKSYKTALGLRNHNMTHHPPSELLTLQTPPTTPTITGTLVYRPQESLSPTAAAAKTVLQNSALKAMATINSVTTPDPSPQHASQNAPTVYTTTQIASHPLFAQTRLTQTALTNVAIPVSKVGVTVPLATIPVSMTTPIQLISQSGAVISATIEQQSVME